MKSKIKLMAAAQFLLLALAFLLLPCFASSQTKTAAKSKDTLNIGFVLYTKSNTPGTLFARWNYANIWSGPGIATGGPKEGFEGNYHVRYFYENGDFSDEYDLTIEKTGGFYNVSWIVKGKVLAKGVGMEVENGLAVGWRRVKD
ncbi:MAG: hypothetical protein K2X48_18965 [Chitinophagaceae bacterium]|nr:hypothetical protein [Chitinophagaceae bacterium]